MSRPHRAAALLLLFAALVLPLASCSTRQSAGESDFHVIATDSNAIYYDHRASRGADKTRLEHSKQLAARLAGELGPELKLRPETTEILVFIHGGMVGEKKGIDGSRVIHENLKAGGLLAQRGRPRTGARKIFPIFLTWDSSLGSSFAHHLFSEERGVGYVGGGRSWFLSTLFGTGIKLPTELATGVVRAPLNLLNNTAKTGQNMDLLFKRVPDLFPTRKRYYQTLATFFPGAPGSPEPEKPADIAGLVEFYRDAHRYQPVGSASRPAFATGLGASLRGAAATRESLSIFARNVPNAPLTTGLGFLFDGAGTPAWNNMIRRTRTLVRPYPTFMDPEVEQGRDPVPGPVKQLFDALALWQQGDGRDVKITLVGHSMGSMVANEIFRDLLRDRQTPRKPVARIDHLIYLAPACSVRDFSDTAGAWLMRNPKAEAHICCLHPSSEYTESLRLPFAKRLPFEPLPSGSLLVWIDEVLGNPVEFADRTLGSFENCVVAWRDLPATPRLHLKAFGHVGQRASRDKIESAGPQEHSGFHRFHFWQDSFLNPLQTEGPFRLGSAK